MDSWLPRCNKTTDGSFGQSRRGAQWMMLPKDENLGDITNVTGIFFASLVPQDQYCQGYVNFCGELVYRFTHKADGACTVCNSGGFIQNGSNEM